MRILAVDIGNTKIALGIIRDGKVGNVFSISTRLSKRILKRELYRVSVRIKQASRTLDAVVICSVVPKALRIVKSALQKNFGSKPFVMGQDMVVPIVNRYRNPKQVGQDRLVGAYAAKVFYKAPAVIIDLGTAITFDVVSAKSEYLGGVIIPGIRLSAESLFEKTALLPKVKIEWPKEIIGRDTKNSILSGLFYGYGALCDGIIKKISETIRQKPSVIVTGGYTALIRKFVRRIDVIDTNLIFKGLYLIYEKSRFVSRR